MNIVWSTGEATSNIEVTDADVYYVSKTNSHSCIGKDTVVLFDFCPKITITMPNVFTPNGDGFNESFVPMETVTESINFLMTNIREINFKVLNRWGKVIYLSEGILPNWNGDNMDTGNICPNGTYYWILNYNDLSGERYELNGFVQLITN